jgi:hypothetical protein
MFEAILTFNVSSYNYSQSVIIKNTFRISRIKTIITDLITHETWMYCNEKRYCWQRVKLVSLFSSSLLKFCTHSLFLPYKLPGYYPPTCEQLSLFFLRFRSHHRPWFWRRVQDMKILITYFYKYRVFFCLRSKYSRHNPVSKHPQPMFFAWADPNFYINTVIQLLKL